MQKAKDSILHAFLLCYMSSASLVQSDNGSDSWFTKKEGIMLVVTIAGVLVRWQHGCLQAAAYVGPGYLRGALT